MLHFIDYPVIFFQTGYDLVQLFMFSSTDSFRFYFLELFEQLIVRTVLPLVALVFVLINLIVDLLYYAVDPRLRVDRTAPGH
jgi:hypothetical protein